MDIAKRTLEFGNEFPYHGKPAVDWAERAALGILADLCDRLGIKWEFEQVDADIRPDIVEAVAAIVRAADAERKLGDSVG